MDNANLKKQQEQLEESENRLKMALEAAGDGIWDWDIPTNKFYCSPKWKVLLGFDTHEIGDSYTEWRACIHPDDLENLDLSLQKHLKDETSNHRVEYRMRHKDGSYIWIQDRGMIISRTERGEPLRFIGTFSDVTAQKVIESTLEEKEIQLRTKVNLF